MNRLTCGAMGQAILACVGALCLLAQTAVADFTPETITISTLGTTAPYYDAQLAAGAVVAGSGWVEGNYAFIAVGFTVELGNPPGETVSGAVVDSLMVPFFDMAEGDPLPLSFRIVRDVTPVNGVLDAPDFSSVVAVFAMPVEWPSYVERDANDVGTVTLLPRSSSGTFLDDTQYWLAMQQLPGGPVGALYQVYWFDDPTGESGIYTSGLLGEDPTVTLGAAPAYSLTFTTVPEPSAGALLALAGAAGLWRRRRRA